MINVEQGNERIPSYSAPNPECTMKVNDIQPPVFLVVIFSSIDSLHNQSSPLMSCYLVRFFLPRDYTVKNSWENDFEF